MPSCRWTCLITAACGVGVAFLGTAVSAFQFPPLSDDINTQHIHRPEAWVGGGFQSSGPINQQPADFGPALGMRQRTANGNPASGDSFQNMTPGSLPGGLSRDGFGSNGMRQSLNSSGSMANGQQYNNNGQSPTGQNGFGQNGRDPNSNNNSFGPNGGSDQSQFGPNGQLPPGMNAAGQNAPPGWNPYGPPMMNGPARLKPKVSWAFESSQPPYVGLLGQIAKPGVYEIERRGTLLSDLVQNVGGMAKDASGQFRIIRNGRPGQSTSYAGASNFELMAGDLIVADARPAQYRQGSAKETADSVQVGFVNLLDRPVVLKLKVEHARLPEILSMMRQDPSLASLVKVVAPLGQRGYGQAHADATLASETVLIFPPNSVKTDRLTSLPQPIKIQRDGDKPAAPDEAVKPAAPADNITPDVTAAPRRQPSVGSWTESAPLPQSAQPVSQPNVEPAESVTEVPPPPEESPKPQRATGIRGSSPRAAIAADRIARDTHMVLAPPAEEPAPNPDVVVHDAAPAPDIQESLPFTDEPLGDEPPRLNAKGKSQSMRLAKDSSDTTLTSADLEAAAVPTGSSWSIWPPILTAGIGLITLLGFSWSLRRRTQATVPNVPMVRSPQQPAATDSQQTATTPRRALLDEIIDDQLPLTEEQIPLASPMQFHGRPQPPKNIRMDQRHPLPKPHTPNIVGATSRNRILEATDTVPETSEAEAPRAARSSSQPTYRIDRRGATGTASKKVVPTEPKSSKSPTGGPLDRALSAVQKREERDA